MAQRWYVANTKPRLEQYAAENLMRQGFGVFYPRYLKTIVKNSKPIRVVLPLYPSYIFVLFDLQKDHWTKIYGTRGVVQLLCASEDRVSPVPCGFVEDLMKTCGKDGYISIDLEAKLIEDYAVGSQLEVVDGPFKGNIGVCAGSAGGRVRLFMTLLSRQVKISLDSAFVFPADLRNTAIGGSPP